MERNAVTVGELPCVTLQVDSTEYLVEFPLSAVIEAEAKLGRSLKAPADWFGAPAKDIPALLRAGLSRHHPEVSEDEIQAICDRLNPEAYAEFAEALGSLAFPRFVARFKENLARAGAGAGSPKTPGGPALLPGLLDPKEPS